jgi:hypothetical protein
MRFIVGLILPVIVLLVCAARVVWVDPRIGEFVGGPTVLEKYRQTNGFDPNDRREEMPPLVKQAELFAEYMDPARVQKGAMPAISKVGSVAPSPNSKFYTPKFVLHGTCYHPSRPEDSLALVWQPGAEDGTLQWVRQGDRLGRFVVDQIKHGAIVYRGGEQKHEMKVQADPAQESLVLSRRSDAGVTSKAAALRPIALNNRRSVAEVSSEGKTVSQGIVDRQNWQQSGPRPP